MELGKYIEYTNLNSNITMKDIEKICNEAIKYHFETVCVNPYYVTLASSLLKDTNILVSTVVGYKYGLSTLPTKSYEAIEAINNGASEIDLYINISALKNNDYEYIKEEIEEIRDSIDGKTLKVVVEIDKLTKEELIRIVEICNNTFVNYIVLSINNLDDIKEFIDIIKDNKNDLLEIKINCNIETIDDINYLIDMGVSKIGTNHGKELMTVNNN